MKKTFKVKIEVDDECFGLKAGEIYEAEKYWLDPIDKFTLIKRIPDGYDPCCNVYRQDVTIVKDKK